MKKNIIFFVLLCAFVGKVFSQTVSEYGNWFYFHFKKEPKTHWATPLSFPQAAADDEKQIVFSAKEKVKMGKIADALKEVYPHPKLHSYFYEVTPFFNSANMEKTKIANRAYRFGYGITFFSKYMWIDNFKVNKNKPIDWTANMESGIRTFGDFNPVDININYIPSFLGGLGHNYDGPKINLEKHFTYKKIAGKETNKARDLDLGHVVSITSRDETFAEAEKHLGKNDGVPQLNYGNDADKHFVFRKFTSQLLTYDGDFRTYGKTNNTDPRYKENITENMVILSYNNKLPLIPLTINTYLNICEQQCDEQIEYYQIQKKFDPTDYQKNKKHYDELEAKNVAEQQGNKVFIQKLRSAYKNKLQKPAIIDIAYNNVFAYRTYGTYQSEIVNRKTGKIEPTNTVVEKFFIDNPKYGKAYYSYDKDFYKGMKDGEIRTIAVIWRDIERTPNHPDYGSGNTVEADKVNRNRYTDNPDFYLHYFKDKFDWKKLEAVLGN